MVAPSKEVAVKNSSEGLAGALAGMKDKAAEAIAGAGDAVKDAALRAGEIGNLGTDSMKSLAEDVNQLMPAIRQAGYHVAGVDVDAALPPKISIHCRLETDLSPDDRACLLRTLEGNRLSTIAVQLLFRVSEIQKILQLGALRASDIVLELGLSPAVRVRYREAPPSA